MQMPKFGILQWDTDMVSENKKIKSRIYYGLLFSLSGFSIWILLSYLYSMNVYEETIVSNLRNFLANFWEIIHYPVSQYFLPKIDSLGTHSSKLFTYEFLYLIFCLIQDFLIGFIFSFFVNMKRKQ